MTIAFEIHHFSDGVDFYNLKSLSIDAQQASSSEKPNSRKDDSYKRSSSGVEDLFSDSPSSKNVVAQKPRKDLKSDILSLFEKVVTISINY